MKRLDHVVKVVTAPGENPMMFAYKDHQEAVDAAVQFKLFGWQAEEGSVTP